jgi:hypothetical protein
MGKKNRQQRRSAQETNNQQGEFMSTTTINPEAQEPKPQPNAGEQPKAEDKKPGFFSVTIDKIKTTIVGGYTFAKESIATAWNAIVAYYNEVKKNIEEKGAVKWFLDGFRKNAYGFLKLSLKVTAFVLVHNLIVNATGFSIFNPMFLLVVLVVAVGLSVYSSIKAQKEFVGKADAKTTGQHLMAEMIAA